MSFMGLMIFWGLGVPSENIFKVIFAVLSFPRDLGVNFTKGNY